MHRSGGVRDERGLLVAEKQKTRDTRGERPIPVVAIVAVALLPVLLLGLAVACPAVACGVAGYLWHFERADAVGGDVWLVGIVRDGEFLPLVRGRALDGAVRLTGMPMQAAVSPESEEVDLAGYDGRVILIRGHDGGGWVYSAEVIARAGPILSALVRLALGSMSGVVLLPVSQTGTP